MGKGVVTVPSNMLYPFFSSTPDMLFTASLASSALGNLKHHNFSAMKNLKPDFESQ
jgi:hypothetical protein